MRVTAWKVAMVQGKTDFADEFRRATLKNQRARADFVLKKPERLDCMNVEYSALLRAYVDQLNNNPEKLFGLQYEQMAERFGVGDLYLFYRQLSADAAHPSIEALARYMGNNEQIKWGPNCDSAEISDTLNLACLFLICACAATTDVQKNDEAARELSGHFKKYNKINGIS